jgi:hypothetical protein
VNTRRLNLVIAGLAFLGWLTFGFMTWFSLTIAPSMATGHVYQIDWHVFWAGARDLVDRDLYRVPLDAGGLPLSAPEFRLPPFSALWAVPFLLVPEPVGAVLWQLLAAVSIAIAAVIGLRVWAIGSPALRAGLVLGPLSVTLFYLEGLHVATNNYLVLALAAIGCLLYLEQHGRAAGVVIGLAIATKLWPATLLVVALRERRWTVLGYALGAVAVQGLAMLAWLGPDVLGPMLATLSVDIPPTGYLIGPSAFAETRPIWNAGLGALVAIGLLLLPLRGRAGVGTAIIAGMAPIGNLWIHYGPTVLFGLSCVGAALKRPRGPDA